MLISKNNSMNFTEQNVEVFLSGTLAQTSNTVEGVREKEGRDGTQKDQRLEIGRGK